MANMHVAAQDGAVVETDELEYVGFWSRVGASPIDTILIIAVTYPLLGLICGEAYFASDAAFIAGRTDFLISYVFPAIAIITFWSVKQATPGKMVIRAKIVDEKTSRTPSTGQYIGRYIGYFLATVVLFLGFIWVAFDSKKQGWHDKLAGTVVVRSKKRQSKEVEFN
jgi:uncharacterized RDD family membrane protein YckC